MSGLRSPYMRHRVARQPEALDNAFTGRAMRRHGRCAATHTKAYRQKHRVANDSLERYELYVGEDAMPDFEGVGQPVKTSASLPFTWSPTPPGVGTTKLYAVTRLRNKYNMLSLNQHPTIIEIDTAGDEVLGPLSDPEILQVMDSETAGEIIVIARYPRDVDRDEADTWNLYVKLGADPVVGVDSPVSTASFGIPAGVDYAWRITEDSLTPGATYHIRVTVTRDGDGTGEYGDSGVTQHEVADTYDIVESTTTLFGGQQYQMGQ